MTSSPFPDRPESRKAILVLERKDIERCAYQKDAARALRDPELFVVDSSSQIDETSPTGLRNIQYGDLLRPGKMLVQSPYDSDVYADVEDASRQFSLHKHLIFSQLCGFLGATRVSVDQVEMTTKTGKATLDLKVNHAAATVEGKVDKFELSRMREELNLGDEFPGGPPDIEAATKLLRDARLLSDAVFKNLVEMRRNLSNPIKKRTLRLNLSSEAKSNLQVVGRVTVPTFVKVSTKLNRVVEEMTEFTLTLTVTF